MPGELEIIARLRTRSRTAEGVGVGIGDDAAVLQMGGERDVLACSDVMTEGVHFRREWSPPGLLGRKALAVTLSDIAAMGGKARYAMLSIALPPTLPAAFVESLLDGLLAYAEASKVVIIGGDTSSAAESLFIDTIALGECDAGRAVRRNGARVGDFIYVTGALGASAAGLLLLERGYRLADEAATVNESTGQWRRELSERVMARAQDEDRADNSASRDCVAEALIGRARAQALLKHLAPTPHLGLGRRIGKGALATAMIDVSDGLSTDLTHLLDESRCGAMIRAAALPIADAVSLLANELAKEPLSLALHGGEEYELLFTAPREYHERMVDLSNEFDVTITEIGEIIAGSGIRLERDGGCEWLKPAGYEHHV